MRHIVTGNPCNPLNVQTNVYWYYTHPARYLSTNEVVFSQRESAYRFTVNNTIADHVYSLTWLEYFEPDVATNPDTTNELITIREVKFVGNGGVVHVGNPEHDSTSTAGSLVNHPYVLDPLTSERGNGRYTVTPFRISFTNSTQFSLTTAGYDTTTDPARHWISVLLSVTRYDANEAQIGRTDYGFDVFGRQTTVTYARNGTTTNQYDNADRLIATTTPSPYSGGTPQTTSYTYGNMGRIETMTLPDGGVVTNSYHPTGELKKTSGTRTYPVEYTYDAQGRMTITRSGFSEDQAINSHHAQVRNDPRHDGPTGRLPSFALLSRSGGLL